MSDYVFRPARQDDRAGITALWQAVFGDSEAFVSAFLDQMRPIAATDLRAG